MTYCPADIAEALEFDLANITKVMKMIAKRHDEINVFTDRERRRKLANKAHGLFAVATVLHGQDRELESIFWGIAKQHPRNRREKRAHVQLGQMVVTEVNGTIKLTPGLAAVTVQSYQFNSVHLKTWSGVCMRVTLELVARDIKKVAASILDLSESEIEMLGEVMAENINLLDKRKHVSGPHFSTMYA